MKREFFALTVLFLIFVAFPAALFAYQTWLTSAPGIRVVELIANAPARGGWQPDTIRINVGEHVRLRISSTDVVHGLSIPELGIAVDEILPGHVEQIEFTATHVGRFPFACTRWCSVDHWRMRGTIEVIDPANPNPPPQTALPPLYQQMRIDIDAPHLAQYVPARRPAAARGELLTTVVAGDLRTYSPSAVFARLRADTSMKAQSDEELWDVIARTWKNVAGDDAIARGRELFARDCAACHGETGKGDGPAGRNLPGLEAMRLDMPEMLAVKRGPADFTDASQMLGASDVLLQGKILRGGMGTGMPEWRTLYTDRDMWDVIGFVRSFVFDYELSSK